MWAHALFTFLWGGLLALERRAFLQAALSRPLPAAGVTGFLLGDVAAGVMVGLVFELFYLGGASLGGSHPDYETLPSVSAAALAATLDGTATSTPALWALSILICAPLGVVGRRVEVWLDARARRYFGRAVAAIDEGGLQRAASQNLRAMWPHFVGYGVLCAGAPALGHFLRPLMAHLPMALIRGLAWSYPALGVVSAAVAVHASQGQGRLKVAALVALVVALGSFAALALRSST
jgi:mannose/fructose/N-acetylgalactosamine-specific phosphotransferase system component IIC